MENSVAVAGGVAAVVIYSSDRTVFSGDGCGCDGDRGYYLGCCPRNARGTACYGCVDDYDDNISIYIAIKSGRVVDSGTNSKSRLDIRRTSRVPTKWQWRRNDSIPMRMTMMIWLDAAADYYYYGSDRSMR